MVCWTSWALNQPEDSLSPDDVEFEGLKYRKRGTHHFWGHHDMSRTLGSLFPGYDAFIREFNLHPTLIPRLVHVHDRWSGEHGDWRIVLYASFANDADAVFFTIWLHSQEDPDK